MIRIGIYGYGNLSRGVEAAIKKNDDMELKGVFTRRDPKDLVINTKTAGVYNVKDVLNFKDKNPALNSKNKRIIIGIIVSNIESLKFSILIATSSAIKRLTTKSWIDNCPISLLPISLNITSTNI